MLRRVLLAISLVAALGVAGFGMASTAEAGGGCHRGGYGGYGGYYGAYYGNYGGYYPNVYRASYYPAAYYAPPVYRSYYGGYGGHHHHCHDDGGITFSIGF